MHFDGVLDEISSIMGTDITLTCISVKLILTRRNSLSLMHPAIVQTSEADEEPHFCSCRIEDVIETGMGITESVHGRYSQEVRKLLP